MDVIRVDFNSVDEDGLVFVPCARLPVAVEVGETVPVVDDEGEFYKAWVERVLEETGDVFVRVPVDHLLASPYRGHDGPAPVIAGYH